MIVRFKRRGGNMISLGISEVQNTPLSSAAIMAPSVEQVAEERRTSLRRAEDKKLWRAYCTLATVCIFTLGFLLWYMVTTNRKMILLQSEAAQARLLAERVPQDFGLFSTIRVRELSKSVVQIHASWNDRNRIVSSAAFHLGDGYFLTVKHAYTNVFERGSYIEEKADRLHLEYNDEEYNLVVIDSGNTFNIETGDDIGDWAIVFSNQPLRLPTMKIATKSRFSLGEPVVRIGNDLGQGIQHSFGHMGPRRRSGLYNSLMPVHGGMSGGPVVNLTGEVIGMCTGRDNRGNYFAFIRPLSPIMFRKVPHLQGKLES